MVFFSGTVFSGSFKNENPEKTLSQNKIVFAETDEHNYKIDEF